MEVQEQLQELITQGWTIEAIARVLEVDRESVSRWLHGGAPRQPGVATLALEHPAFRRPVGWGSRPRPVAEGQTVPQAFEELMERGWTITAIGDVLGVAQDRASKWRNGEKPERPKMLVMALDHPIFRKQKPPKKRRYTTKRVYRPRVAPGERGFSL